jgi:DNA-binding transcriptional MerR regulator
MPYSDMLNKESYSISEVSEAVGSAPHVLLYWESEFPPLSPNKDVQGERVYSHGDIAIIRRIIELLYIEKLDMRSARAQLAKGFSQGD